MVVLDRVTEIVTPLRQRIHFPEPSFDSKVRESSEFPTGPSCYLSQTPRSILIHENPVAGRVEITLFMLSSESSTRLRHFTEYKTTRRR